MLSFLTRNTSYLLKNVANNEALLEKKMQRHKGSQETIIIKKKSALDMVADDVSPSERVDVFQTQ